MELTALLKSKIKFRVHSPTITKRWGMLLLICTVLLITINLLRPMNPQPLNRPKTILTLNNKNMCKSNSMLVHRHSRSDVSSSPTDRSLVIIVLSSRGNFMKRKLVRQTYGSIRSANNITILAVVFMLGNVDASGGIKVDQSELEAENMEYGDLIMGDFVDVYRNLTRKTIMAYEWLTSFCCEAQLVMKTDDDVMVNVFRLTEVLNELPTTDVTSSKIWCEIQYNETDITNENSKFYVPPYIFPGTIFPPHRGGAGYFTSMSVISRITNEISNTFVERVCTHEDVFMTAIVPQEINKKLKSDGQRDNFIELVDTSIYWITYPLELLYGDNAEFLLNILNQSVIETVDFNRFREIFGKKIFYLLRHDREFELRYANLWKVIEMTFRNQTKGDMRKINIS